MASIYNQDHFRIRLDATAAEGGTPFWAAAQDVNSNITIGTKFRIRFAISNTGTVGTAHTWTVNSSRNAGAFAAVTTITTPAQAVDATNGASADQSAITTQLLTGVGTFQIDGEYTSMGVTGTLVGFPANSCRELEFGLQITSAASLGDTFDFRVDVGSTVLATYAFTPRLTVVSTVLGKRLNVLLRR